MAKTTAKPLPPITCFACSDVITPKDAKHDKEIRQAAAVNKNGSWCARCAAIEMDLRKNEINEMSTAWRVRQGLLPEQPQDWSWLV